jgi:hypothetical protein
VLRIRDPALFWPLVRYLDPGSGMEKNPNPDLVSGMNIPDNFSESLETVFWVKIFNFFDADPIFLIRDPGWKNSDPKSGINIPAASGHASHHSEIT